MASKFELSISTSYVPDWGLVEAFRELFQNALDNETVNPTNKMGWLFDKKSGVVKISNKTSKLTVESLLLGSGTKHDRKDTIGKHGEGYKIAFMVLLRNNKTILVENYGANEIWEVRLVKSRKYNGQLVPTVFVNKEPIWKKKPNSDLVITIGNITEDEYEELEKKNLHLRKEPVKAFDVEGRGSVILDDTESGNIYVEGLFVTHVDGFKYGYNFVPSVLGLDRDRKMVDSFNVSWEASILWNRLSDIDKGLRELAVSLIKDEYNDVAYVSNTISTHKSLANAYASNFFAEYGDNAVPVTSNFEYNDVSEDGKYKPIIVTERKAEILKKSDMSEKVVPVEIKPLKQKFEAFLEKIEGKLSDEEVEEFNNLIEQIN